jgi:hypothetical protein
MMFHKVTLYNGLRKRRRGTALVEFALIVPIMLALLLGIMEFGWLAKTKLQLSNAAREGARDAAIGLSTSSIETRIRNRSAGLPGVPDKLQISLMRDDGDDTSYDYTIPLGNKPANSDGKVFNDAPAGALVRVRVTLPYQPLTNIPFTQSRTLQVDVIMRREDSG